MSPTKKVVKLIKNNNCFLTRHTSSTDIHPFLNTRQNIKSHVQQNKTNIVKFENGNSFLFFIFCSIGKCFGCVLVNCKTIIVFCLQYSCSICLFRFKKENTRSWNLFKANKKKTSEWRHWRRSASLLLTMNRFYLFFWYSIIEFEQVNASWVLPPLFLIKSHSCSSSANAASS